MEAAVQRSPSDAQVWFQLGVKQQENEREGKAIQALRRALELDPSHLPSWLALAISHTNEGNRHGSYEAIREWVNHNERYGEAVNAYRLQTPERDDMGQAERFNSMIDCLITMARWISSLMIPFTNCIFRYPCLSAKLNIPLAYFSRIL